MNCKGRGKTRSGTVSWYLNAGSLEYEARVHPLDSEVRYLPVADESGTILLFGKPFKRERKKQSARHDRV
jgi:hypothetical protein